MKMNVIMIIASTGFQDMEYHATRAELERDGAHIVTLSDQAGEAISALGKRVRVDGDLTALKTSPYDAIVLVGGPGAWEALNIPLLHQELRKAVQSNKIIAAICISPRILAVAEILRGKRATGWDGDNKLGPLYAQYGVVYEKKPVVVDGQFVTADGPSSASAFGAAIVKLFEI